MEPAAEFTFICCKSLKRSALPTTTPPTEEALAQFGGVFTRSSAGERFMFTNGKQACTPSGACLAVFPGKRTYDGPKHVFLRAVEGNWICYSNSRADRRVPKKQIAPEAEAEEAVAEEAVAEETVAEEAVAEEAVMEEAVTEEAVAEEAVAEEAVAEEAVAEEATKHRSAFVTVRKPRRSPVTIEPIAPIARSPVLTPSSPTPAEELAQQVKMAELGYMKSAQAELEKITRKSNELRDIIATIREKYNISF